MATAPFTISPSSLKNLHNKTILITGGSSGIGLRTAELFFSISPTTNISVLDLSPIPSTSPLSKPENSHRVFFHKCNVTVWKEQRAGFAATVSRFGYLDTVFVNAGIPEYGNQLFKDELDADGELKEPDRRVYDVDLAAANDTVKLAIYWMKRTLGKVESRTGSIVMTASLAGYLASAGAPLYSAAKHGIVGLMRALKHDTATLNIAVSVVAPGVTVTPIISAPIERPGIDVEEWAAKMAKLGVPISKPETIALAVAHLVDLGMKANGMGLLVQTDKVVDVERGLAKSRAQWMSKEMLDLFRGGRNAPLFENKL